MPHARHALDVQTTASDPAPRHRDDWASTEVSWHPSSPYSGAAALGTTPLPDREHQSIAQRHACWVRTAGGHQTTSYTWGPRGEQRHPSTA
jgi:hypothetical protein